MLKKMAKHAQKIQVKSMELSVEKRRADTLLCQMLPKEIAEQLKMNREVKAEQFKVMSRTREITDNRLKVRVGSVRVKSRPNSSTP